MGDLASFERELLAFEKQIELEVGNVTVAMATILFAKIVSRTPFYTGRARSSWQISIGSMNKAVNAPGRYPQYEDPTAAYALAIAEARRILADYPPRVFGRPPIYITNRLRYIPFLERGTNKIKPAAMVSLSVAEVNLQFGHVTTGTLGAVGVVVQ